MSRKKKIIWFKQTHEKGTMAIRNYRIKERTFYDKPHLPPSQNTFSAQRRKAQNRIPSNVQSKPSRKQDSQWCHYIINNSSATDQKNVKYMHNRNIEKKKSDITQELLMC